MSISPRSLYGIVALASFVIAIFSWLNYQNQEILIEWATASELDAAGFNIYRSPSSDGPFEKINPQMIPTSDDPLTGASYEFRDADVTPGQTYFYRLEEVEFTGGTIDLGTTSSSVSNLPLILAGLAVLLFLAAGISSVFAKPESFDAADD